MSTWSYAEDGMQFGPVSVEELKSKLFSGELPPDTLVWTQGMPAWAQATSVPQLGMSATPPPLRAGGAPTLTSNLNDAEQNKAMGMLAYIGILWLVPFLAAKESPFAKYHVNQGLTLIICTSIVWFAIRMLIYLPFFGWMLAVLMPMVGLAYLIFAALGVMAASKGEMKPLPIIGELFNLIT